MKIAIVSTIDPFIKGGARIQFQNLYKLLSKHYKNVDLFFIPFSYELNDLEIQINSLRKITIDCDLLITSRPMSYCINHPNKVLWFMHHISYFYEFSNSRLNPYINHSNFQNIKQEFIKKDTFFIKESQKIFAVSNFVAKKLENFNNVQSQVLYPFLDNIEQFHFKQYSDFFFLPSLITFTKRQHLIMESLLYTKNPIKLVLAGQIDTKYYKKYIKPLLKHKKIKQNVKIIDFINQEKYDYYANCLGVIFTPVNEAFGYVVLEGFFSRKLVITTVDAGGPTELVKNGFNGFVLNSNPQEIAQILDTIYENRKLAQELGKNAFEYAIINFNSTKTEKEILEKLIIF